MRKITYLFVRTLNFVAFFHQVWLAFRCTFAKGSWLLFRLLDWLIFTFDHMLLGVFFSLQVVKVVILVLVLVVIALDHLHDNRLDVVLALGIIHLGIPVVDGSKALRLP